ncbi:hypothetical protein AB0D33_01435 [Streptomyces sp. NPDC048404]|uniref:hypothetical protein n=1 Tax=unclassified Streptomyces TaxID=2593676 RepID=UPI003430E4D3
MTQLPLPLDDIDWADIDPDEDEWDDEDELDDPDPRLRDLDGQGLTAVQLHTITDVPLTGRYL